MGTEDNTPALLIVAHGSTDREVDNDAIVAIGEHLRQDGAFAEVGVGFIKAKPEAADALAELRAQSVVVVPLLIGEGVFYRRVLPRKLGCEALEALATCVVGEKRLIYAHAAGVHPAMIELVRRRVDGARDAFAELPERPRLLLVGHGAAGSAASSLPTRERAERLREDGDFAEVRVAFLDEAPFLADEVDAMGGDVLVVPDFVGEGLHTLTDIPAAIGLVDYDGGFARVDRGARRLWYTPPTGTHPHIAGVLLAQARQALAERR